MRLAFLGNAFEMEECVRECLASLGDGLTPTDALTVLKEAPEELREHEAAVGVGKKVIAVLANALDKWTESDPPRASEKDTPVPPPFQARASPVFVVGVCCQRHYRVFNCRGVGPPSVHPALEPRHAPDGP